MKPLLPSLKEHKRYLVYEVIAAQEVTKKASEQAIMESLTTYVGLRGQAEAGVIFLKDWKHQRGIMRITHTATLPVRASLTMVKKVGTKQATVRSVAISGILAKARKHVELE